MKLREGMRAKFAEYISIINDRLNNSVGQITDDQQNAILTAQNIIKLSTAKECKNIPTEQLSVYTPASLIQIITSNAAKYGFKASVPDKRLFDNLPQFVPCKKTTQVSYYLRNKKAVYINPKEKRTSDIYRLISHEYGHANEALHFEDREKIRDAWEQVKKQLAEASPKLVDEYTKLKRELDKEPTEAMTRKLYQLGEVSDMIGSLKGSYGPIGWGHERSYWSVKGNAENEFFAHCSELFFTGNYFLERFLPTVFKEMKNLAGLFF